MKKQNIEILKGILRVNALGLNLSETERKKFNLWFDSWVISPIQEVLDSEELSNKIISNRHFTSPTTNEKVRGNGLILSDLKINERRF